MHTKPFLVLGIGNLLRTDDGVGVHVVNLLNDSKKLPGWVEAIDAGTCGPDLLGMMQGRDRVIVVDALEAGEEPGGIFRFDARLLAFFAPMTVSLHDSGIVGALRDLEVLGERPDVEIIGIAAQDVTTMSMEPTCAVKAAVPKAAELVLHAAEDYHKAKATDEVMSQQ
jgi:hydrogenase maturation protease